MLEVKQTLNILSGENKEAAKVAAKLTAGNILNDRAIKLVQPHLPMMVKGYADTDLGRAIVANVIAGAVMHVAPTNDKAVMASEAMIHSAMVTLVGTFDIEATVNEFLDGINLDVLKAEEAETQRGDS